MIVRSHLTARIRDYIGRPLVIANDTTEKRLEGCSHVCLLSADGESNGKLHTQREDRKTRQARIAV